MKSKYFPIVLVVSIVLFVPFEQVLAQEVINTRGITGGGGSPLGNIYIDSGTTVGTAAGTYTTAVTHSDGSYTLHHITVDAASNVVSHTTETFDGDGESNGTDTVHDSTGKKMGDVIGGGLENSFYSDPSQCLSINCDSDPFGDPSGDPYSWSFTSNSINGG